ncbi:MAG: N-acetylmuramoyl-L-alanine amidase [Rhizobiaceae bacterium]
MPRHDRRPATVLLAFGLFIVSLLLSPVWLAADAMAGEDGSLRAKDFRMAGDAARTRIVLNFDKPFQPKWFLLSKPFRLVIDMPTAAFAVDPANTRAKGLVSIVRYGRFDDARSRMILGGNAPFAVESIDVLKNDDGSGHRLAIDLAASSAEAFDQALARQSGLKAEIRTAPKDDRLGARQRSADGSHPFTVVLDPGHGGIDGGARSVGGAVEKNITLAFAIGLKKKLEQAGDIRVFLTRDDDRFLRLSERVALARQYEADLFISVHADTIRFRSVRGATVYTVSDEASDEVAHAIASSENLADQLAGIAPEEASHEVADILLDLMRRETQTFSIRFARSLVGEMSHTVELIKNPHRFAGFRVLTAPDVPSVLLELGYLSNPKDESLLRDPKWRDKAGDSIVAAVKKYAAAHAEMGG